MRILCSICLLRLVVWINSGVSVFRRRQGWFCLARAERGQESRERGSRREGRKGDKTRQTTDRPRNWELCTLNSCRRKDCRSQSLYFLLRAYQPVGASQSIQYLHSPPETHLISSTQYLLFPCPSCALARGDSNACVWRLRNALVDTAEEIRQKNASIPVSAGSLPFSTCFDPFLSPDPLLLS